MCLITQGPCNPAKAKQKLTHLVFEKGTSVPPLPPRGAEDSEVVPAADPRPPEPEAASLPQPPCQAPPSGAHVGPEPPSGSGSLPGRDKVSATLPDASRRRGRSQP